ncbi:hypothetical protein B0675_17490 [Streptomyces sp. M41(2017)]|nr:hypothetical protein B0675_17490 [Streptomyces sp. M41(2017)]
MTPSPETVSRLRKFPSRIDTRAASMRLRAAVSTSVVPPRDARPLFRDCPPFARVLPPRVAAPDSTVSLPQGSTITARRTRVLLLGVRRRHSACPDLLHGACPVFHPG